MDKVIVSRVPDGFTWSAQASNGREIRSSSVVFRSIFNAARDAHNALKSGADYLLLTPSGPFTIKGTANVS